MENYHLIIHMSSWKESMINRLSNLINRNRSAAKISQVLCSSSDLSRLECSEKYKSFKLKIPQPDSERRHSPDFRTVFGIMIGPFSSCEIGKT